MARSLLFAVAAMNLVAGSPIHHVFRPSTLPPETGVVVENVDKGSAGERAGIARGDMLTSWSKPRSREGRGVIDSPFGFRDLEVEQAPRGPLDLTLVRSGHERTVRVNPGVWGVRVMPVLSPSSLERYVAAGTLIERRAVKAGADGWRALATELAIGGNHLEAAWLLSRVAVVYADSRRRTSGEEAFDDAIRETKAAGSVIAEAQIWDSRATTSRLHADFQAAETSYRRALATRGPDRAETLAAASDWNGVGVALLRAGTLDESAAAFGRARAVEEKLAPDDIEFAESLSGLGDVAARRARWTEAEPLLRSALAIRERLRPDGLEVAASLRSLARLETDLRRWAEALQLYRRALAIYERLAPESLELAGCLDNYVSAGGYGDDFDAADRAGRRALAIRETVAPGSVEVAQGLNNLATLLIQRGDLVAADDYLRRAAAIQERAARNSVNTGIPYINLGEIATLRGDFEEARVLYERALVIFEGQALETEDLAQTLIDLAEAEDRLGHKERAESLYARALPIRRKMGPEPEGELLREMAVMAFRHGELDRAERLFRRALAPGTERDALSLGTSQIWNGLADIEARRGSPEAEIDYRKALEIRTHRAPGSQWEAQTLHGLGLFYRDAGRKAEAARCLGRAIDALESQKQKLGGTEEERGIFSASHADYYRDYIEVLIELGKKSEAFRTLERSRARALLAMLAERELAFAPDVPADLERERRLTDAAYDRARDELRDLSPSNGEKLRELMARLHDLRAKQEQVGERLRKASPRYEALQYPKPLDVAATRAALDPGTMLLSYSVGKEKSYLFIVAADSRSESSLTILTLPVGEKALRESVRAFQKLIEWGESSPELAARARALYGTLVRPAERMIADSQRLLVVPDGPLLTLPWAALARSEPSGETRFLVEWKPVHTAISATVYAELQKWRRSAITSAVEVAAFGDPKYPGDREKLIVTRGGDEEAPDEEAVERETLSDPHVRSVLRGGFRFNPLPASRWEVEQIVRLYAPKAAAYLGADATEERAKSIGKDVPLIHFACHAVINERFPLDSALVFTIPDHPKEGQDNGLLQAWEIFEKVRIDADLVTLSACESGLGKEMGGEGLIGLTRAFQYAGARSVLASLWKVEDRATGELMKRFYVYLKAGKPKDEALRLAQIDLIRSSELSQPISWAAFQLNGDWK